MPTSRLSLQNSLGLAYLPEHRQAVSVFDPFLGSGTTAAVAKTLGRHYVGLELNPECIELTHKRLADVQLPLLT